MHMTCIYTMVYVWRSVLSFYLYMGFRITMSPKACLASVFSGIASAFSGSAIWPALWGWSVSPITCLSLDKAAPVAMEP